MLVIFKSWSATWADVGYRYKYWMLKEPNQILMIPTEKEDTNSSRRQKQHTLIP